MNDLQFVDKSFLTSLIVTIVSSAWSFINQKDLSQFPKLLSRF